MFKKILIVTIMTLMFTSLSFAQNSESSKSNSTTTLGNSDGLLGISLDLTTMKEWNIVFNASQRLSIVAILGFDYYDDDNDDHFNMVFGAGAIVLLTKQLLPISLEADLKYSSEDWVGFDFMMDLALPVLPHFNLVGKAGIDISIGTEDPNPVEFSPITKISAVWFFI